MDGTRSWLIQNKQNIDRKFTQCQIFLNDVNVGFTAAVNQGLNVVNAEYILLLNPDVVVQTNSLAILVEQLKRNTKMGVIAPQLRYLNNQIQSSCRRFPRRRDVVFDLLGFPLFFKRFDHWKMSDFDHTYSRIVDQPQGAFLLCKFNVYHSVGKLDSRFQMFFSDVDWCLRIKNKGWQIWFCADTFVYHAKGMSIRPNRTRMIVSSHRAFVQYFKKYDVTWVEQFGTKFVHFLLLVVLPIRIVVSYIFSRQK
jgi:hypothetical protein